MNHGGIGYVSSLGELTIGNGFLNSLSLGQDSKLYGVYYPPTKAKAYKHVTLKHDFMLTPIPPKLWPVSARLQLFLSHRIGSINEVCKFLVAQKVSIIHAESSRSAHRYDTWNLHIAFPDLLKEKASLNFNSIGNFYNETKEAIDNLIKSLNNAKKLKPYIFAIEYSTKIGGDPNSSLAYFDNYVKRKKSLSTNIQYLYEPFELTLDTTALPPVFKGDKFADILNVIAKDELDRHENIEVFPATVFTELDTRELNIRMVIIPPADSKRFFTAGIEFRRIGGDDSCIGIMQAITEKLLASNYNIWHSYNYSINSTLNSDRGRFVFFVEDMCNVDKEYADPKLLEVYISEAERNLLRIVKDVKTKFMDFTLLPVTPLLDFGSIKKLFEISTKEDYSKFFYNDVFISYSHVNENFVTKTLLPILDKFHVKYDIDSNFLKAGIEFDDEIPQRIFNCREMCVVLSKKSVAKEWPTTEWGAAWALRKIITPIPMPGVIIPDRLKNKLYVKSNSIEMLEKYAKELIARRYQRNADIAWKYYRKH